MIVFRRFGLAIGECYLDEAVPRLDGKDRVDIFRSLLRTTPMQAASSRSSQTIFVDLTASADTLQARLDRNTRRQIRQAEASAEFCVERDGDDCLASDSLNAFMDYSDAFSRGKGLKPCNRARLTQMADSQMLLLSRAVNSDGEALAWHASVRVGNRVCVLLSPSLLPVRSHSDDRMCVGRANRYLHWTDMLWHRDKGVTIYDLGGWSPDPRLAGVNRFKLEFGGSIVTVYSATVGMSLKGRLAQRIVPNR